MVDELPKDLFDITKYSGTEKTNRIIDNTLKIEHNQRNKILNGLKLADQNDLILISDVDEIPKLEEIRAKIKNKIILFRQRMFYYKFNLMYKGLAWSGTKAVKKKDLISPQWLRDVKDRKYSIWRLDILFNKMKYNNIQFIEDGGWHFTNFRTPKELELKLNNFGHHAEYKESGLNIKDIENMINKNKAIYDYQADMRTNKWSGKQSLEKVNEDYLPEYVIKNKEIYKDWFVK